jgi:chromate transporter
MPEHESINDSEKSVLGVGNSVSLGTAFRVWCKVAVLSFGGPAGQIAVMHRILVEEKRWVSEDRFLHALNYCMLLPGPEAQQLATYTGWLLHRTLGGLMAGLLFILPGFLSILLLSMIYVSFPDSILVQGVFYGLKPAIVAVVIEAVLRIGRRSLKNSTMVGVAFAAFVAIFFFQVPFPLIVLSAGLIGFIGGRIRPDVFVVLGGHASKSSSADTNLISDHQKETGAPSWKRSAVVLAIWLPLWFVPIVMLAIFTGRESVFTQEAVFFSKSAVVTFGGAYSVLSYIAEEAVSTYGWLKPAEMMDGLGMAETTPGPLIQVVQFVGFMGAYRNPGSLDPMVAGILGSLITTWVTFVPCFLWIFLGAPYIESLRGRRSLNAALSTITAAVVGVILNLSIWFALHTLFGVINETSWNGVRLLIPEWSTVDFAALLLCLSAFVSLFVVRRGVLRTLALSSLVGLVYFAVRSALLGRA